MYVPFFCSKRAEASGVKCNVYHVSFSLRMAPFIAELSRGPTCPIFQKVPKSYKKLVFHIFISCKANKKRFKRKITE